MIRRRVGLLDDPDSERIRAVRLKWHSLGRSLIKDLRVNGRREIPRGA